MKEVVSASRRIERILEERPTSGMEQLIESMQSQIQILTKDLAKAHEQIAAKPPAATPTAAFTAPPSNTVAAAQPPPAASAPPSLPSPQPHRYHPWQRHNHPHITRAILHILAMEKRVHTFVGKGGSQIEGLRGASSATRRATLPIAALPVPYCNACCGSRRKKTPEAHPGDKSWSSPHQMVTKALLRGI